jgi:cytochrome P450
MSASFVPREVNMSTSSGLAIALLSVVIVLGLRSASTARSRKRLPPGPPSSFWSGSYIPLQHPWRKLKEYTDTYGDLITLKLANGKLLFICGSATSADAILNKQSAVTSDRPHLIMAGDLLSGGKRMLILGYNDRWRKYRKIMHEALNNTVAVRYESIQEHEATLTAHFIGLDPSNFQQHLSRYAASTIMTITYDYPVKSLDDPLLQSVNDCLGNLGKWINPSASPLDSYPVLNYLPTVINPWKKLGKQLHQQELELFLKVYRDVRKRAQQGKAQSCFATLLQERQAEYQLTDEEACYLTGSLFGAG